MLTRTEELLLLAVHALADDASGSRIREHLDMTTGQRTSVGALYVPLERMVRRGLLEAREGEPTPTRGGRRRRYYRVTADGRRALVHARDVAARAWLSAGLAEPRDGVKTT